jgi:uncharacterized protein (DUF362 family)
MDEARNRSRRDFIKCSLAAGVTLAAANSSLRALTTGSTPPSPLTPVALHAGADRSQNIFMGLKFFEKEIRRAVGDKQVVIKPNIVSSQRQLSATHVDCLEGILEFLRSIRVHNVVIAESAADGPAMNGYENYGYLGLADKYRAALVDLDREPVEIVHVFDETDFRPHPVRMARRLLDPNSFIISAAVMKTHDRVLATLSLKNIVFGAPIKDEGYAWGPSRRQGARTDKPIPHGSGLRAINYNLFALAPKLHPHLAVIDGYEGMEGNGPIGGTPVDHRVAVVGTDWLAADRVALELMGIDFAKVGYLNYCAGAGMGESDLGKIEIVGSSLKDHRRSYRLSDNIEKQLIWMQPAQPS